MNMMDAHKNSDGGRDCVEFWSRAGTAGHYSAASKAFQTERIEGIIRRLGADASFKALDIGAGPGNLAIPLAEKAALVTAVEPAKGMLAVLEKGIGEKGLKNLKCVPKRWEDVDPEQDLEGPYDAVVCSFALGMRDLEAALHKMKRVCRGRVHLYWFSGETSWTAHYRKLYPAMHGSEYRPMPDAKVLCGVLEQMGADFKTAEFSYSSQSRFAGLDEAVDFYRYRYNVKTEAQENVLKEYLDQILRHDNGDRVADIRADGVEIRWNVRNG